MTEHTETSGFGGVLSDYVGMTDDALATELRQLELARRTIDARLAAVPTVAEGRAVFAADGHRSMKAYLRAPLTCSGAHASRVRRRARAAAELRGVGEAWLDGHIGSDQVDAVAKRHANPRVRDQLPESMPMLLEHAEHLEHDDFEAVLTRWEMFADLDGAFDESDASLRDRDACVTASESGLEVHAHGGDALRAVQMESIFERFVEAEFRKDSDARSSDIDPLPRTAAQRRADALVELFGAAEAASKAGLTPVLPAPVVNILFDAATFGETMHRHGLSGSTDPLGVGPVDILDRRCSTSSGVALHPDQALSAALDGRVRRVVLDSKSVVIDHGLRQRLFTGASRDAARLTTTACHHSGCRIPGRWCDVDHLQPALHGGPTDQHNAGLLCSWHNRHKHRRRFGSRRACIGRVFTLRSDGTPLLAAGQRTPEWTDPDPPG